MEDDNLKKSDMNNSASAESDSSDSVQMIPTPTTPARLEKSLNMSTVSGSGGKSPITPSSTKKRKRLSSKERDEREKERAEKKAKLEEEKSKKDEEKQRREEERRKREEEKQQKLQQKEQERIKREEEKKKKQEEDEKKRKEREEEKKRKQDEEEKKKREKEEEKRLKEAEKKKKLEEEEKKKKEREEERLKKLEEKEMKEQERLKKIEEQEKEKKRGEEQLAKQAKLLQSFFKSPGAAKPNPSKRNSITSACQGDKTTDIVCLDGGDPNGRECSPKPRNKNAFNPMMFEVKSSMALAPLIRRAKLTASQVENFDSLYLSESKNISEESEDKMDVDEDEATYISWLKQIKNRGGRKYGRTELLSETEADVQVISNTHIENPKAQGLVKWRYKLLQFHDNKRPAYWGTWKKLSSCVKPTKPWGKEKELDYEFDSDDEWEEEPEDAEDLAASDKDDETENAEEEEDDEDGWLVPHGYLSDDEGAMDEHLDKETLKEEEKEYYEGLKKQPKIKYPEIQTERLIDFKIIFCPLRKKWKEHCKANKSIPNGEEALPNITEEAA